jgi:hypothetical protein
MSGPFFLASDVGCIGGSMINHAGISINGFAGSAVLFVETIIDEAMFDLLISGRLKVKEKVCAQQRTPRDRAPRGATYKPVCSKVKP